MDLIALLSGTLAVIAPVFVVALIGFAWFKARLPYDSAFITTFAVNVSFNYLWALRYNNAPEEVAAMVLGSTVMAFAGPAPAAADGHVAEKRIAARRGSCKLARLPGTGKSHGE
jgi:hypothetical protein